MNQWAAHVEFTSCNTYLNYHCHNSSLICMYICLVCVHMGIFNRKIFKNMHFNNQSDILQKVYIYMDTWDKQKSAFKILWHLVEIPVFSLRPYVRKA